MEIKEKLNWLKNATDEELLSQLVNLNFRNKYGCNHEDIVLTKREILSRMAK